MSEETKQPKEPTHWRKLINNKYIGAHDFKQGQELTVTIESIVTEKIKSEKGDEEPCIVARFVGAKKPMVMNKTNCKIVTKVLETAFVEDWVGKKIILYSAKVKAFGEWTEAIRVKNQKV